MWYLKLLNVVSPNWYRIPLYRVVDAALSGIEYLLSIDNDFQLKKSNRVGILRYRKINGDNPS